MTIQQWILKQTPEIQMETWKRISHFLNNNELKYIMQGVSRGQSLMTLHDELNLFEKYQIDMLRTMDIIRRLYPEEVDMDNQENETL
jgi:hypothetical protein